jgi:hypothetical protein
MIRTRQFSDLEPMKVTEISKLFIFFGPKERLSIQYKGLCFTGQAVMNNLEFDSLFLKHRTVIYSHVM